MKKLYMQPETQWLEMDDNYIIATSDTPPQIKNAYSNTEDYNLANKRGALDDMLDDSDF